MSVTDNKKRWEAHLKQLEQLELQAVHVGVVGDNPDTRKDGAGPSNAEIALWHEMGAGVPKRSWLLDPAAAMANKIEKVFRTDIKKYLESTDTSPVQHLLRAGLWLAGQLQANIAKGIDPANKQSTIDRKGSSKPLIDSGQMRAAITAVVRDADKGT